MQRDMERMMGEAEGEAGEVYGCGQALGGTQEGAWRI